MAYVSTDGSGKITGFFNCPQPDAFDEAGHLICQGTPTVELPDDDPDLIAYLAQAQQNGGANGA